MLQVRTLLSVLAIAVPLAALVLLVTKASGTVLRTDKGITGKSVVTKTAVKRISNPNGPCLSIHNARDRVIKDLILGPCGGHGIEILDSRDITIQGVTIENTKDSGIYVEDSSNVEITESRVANTISGIYAVASKGIRVSCNTIVNPRGPIPRGQFVQFNKVRGGSNYIRCNAGRNEPGRGHEPEDAISLYQSRGTAEQPIMVDSNLIVGGGPSPSGGGIMLGDDGGQHQTASNNVLVDPGQYGIAVSSGQHMAIVNNRVFGRRQSFTNVGIYTWNQYPHRCDGIRVEGNQVTWTSNKGRPNPFWDGENCGRIRGEAKNNFAARLSAQIETTVKHTCSCATNGRR